MQHGPGPHFITGPVYVRGAKVGDTLQVDILDVKIRQDWGFVSILPLLGNAAGRVHRLRDDPSGDRS